MSILSTHVCNELSNTNYQNIHLCFKVKDCPIFALFDELGQRSNCRDLLSDQDNEGCTVVHYASKLASVHFLDKFMSLGAEINVRCNGKRSPLHYAALGGHDLVCRKLLSGSDWKKFINERDVAGFTALHLACMNGHANIVQLLILAGAMLYKYVRNEGIY